MNEELEQSVSGNNPGEQSDNNTYIEAIKEMKKNTVSREVYDKLAKENKDLLQALVDGETINIEKPEEQVDLNQLKSEIRNAETSLEGFSKALQYRNECLKRGMVDPFLPGSSQVKKILPTDEDIATANRVAAGLQHCVDYADGDPEIFATELMRITVDSAPQRKR